MTRGGRVPTPWLLERLWTLSDDHRTVRLQLPPAKGQLKTRYSFLDFDARALDELLDRLIRMRSRMIPPPPGY